MSKQMTVAIAGLGSRGRDTYAKVAKLCSDKMKIVAIADIDPEKESSPDSCVKCYTMFLPFLLIKGVIT